MMKIRKYELARAIDKAKGIVMKNNAFPALECILIDGQSAVASNTEITIEVKIEGSYGTSILLPMRAFDMVKNLPDGELDIDQDPGSEVVTIRMEKLKSSFSSYHPDDFTLRKDRPEGEGLLLPGKELISALSKVVFAADEASVQMPIRGVNIKASGGVLTITATDGHVLAYDEVIARGIEDVNLIIPKKTVKKLIEMGMDDDIRITYDRNSAVFETAEYTIFTRLIAGNYLDVSRLLAGESQLTSFRMNRKELQAAITRANLCSTEERKPLVAHFTGGTVDISIAGNTSGYSEILEAQSDFTGEIRMGFNTKLLIDALKGYAGSYITLKILKPSAPAFFSEEGSALKVMVLPVKI